MKEITVVEIIQAKPGKVVELKKALSELVPISRAEVGCLQYDLLEPAGEKGEFLVLMRWKSMSDLKRHESSKPIQVFVEKYDAVLYGNVIQTEWTSV